MYFVHFFLLRSKAVIVFLVLYFKQCEPLDVSELWSYKLSGRFPFLLVNFQNSYRDQSDVDLNLYETYFTSLISQRIGLLNEVYCQSCPASFYVNFLERGLAMRKDCAPVKSELFLQVTELFSKMYIFKCFQPLQRFLDRMNSLRSSFRFSLISQ